MKMNKGVVGLALAVAGVAAVSQAPAVFAQQKADEHSPVSVSSVAISEAVATATAEKELPGTVKSAHLSMDHSTATWKIRILSTDGLQRGDFRIDATTGVVLKSKIKAIRSQQADRATRLADKLEKKRLHSAERLHKSELKKNHLELRGQKSK